MTRWGRPTFFRFGGNLTKKRSFKNVVILLCLPLLLSCGGKWLEEDCPVTLRTNGDGLWIDTQDSLKVGGILLAIEGVFHTEAALGGKYMGATISEVDGITYVQMVAHPEHWIPTGTQWLYWRADQMPKFHKYPDVLSWIVVGTDGTNSETWIRCLDWGQTL